MRIEARPEFRSIPEKSNFPPEIFLPVFVLVERAWENSSEEEQKMLSSLLKNNEKDKEAILKAITESLLARVSWLMPPAEIQKISQGMSFGELPSSDLEELSRSQYILYNQLGFLEERKSLENLGQQLSISRQRVQQLKDTAESKILAKLRETKVQTLTGEKTLLGILRENLEIILEKIGEKNKILSYANAPEEIWQAVWFLSQTVHDDFGLKARVEEETADLVLSSPYDFLFSQRVLGPLSELSARMTIPVYSKRLVYSRFLSLLEGFRVTFADEMPTGRGTLPWLLDETRENIIFWRRLKPADFGDGSLATRVCNALLRAGIASPTALLRRDDDDLSRIRGLGTVGMRRILEFLLSEYPNEDLTKKLGRFLLQKGN